MHAELSSLASTIGTAKNRVTDLVDSLHAERDAALVAVLHEVERSLGSVHRQLDRATRLARDEGSS